MSMMSRVDYLNDPEAPPANSIVPSVSVVAVDESGSILMIKKTDNGLWALPGGGVDIGETAAQAAVREVQEETGIEVELTGLTGIYTNPKHVVAYDDGEVRQQFALCFSARPTGGSIATSNESSAVKFVAVGELDGLNIHPSMRLRIEHYIEHRDEPYIG